MPADGLWQWLVWLSVCLMTEPRSLNVWATALTRQRALRMLVAVATPCQRSQHPVAVFALGMAAATYPATV